MSPSKDKDGNAPSLLRICKDNPRYFADDTGKAIYLTGSHTWGNFKDTGKSDPPPEFDYDAYLDFLEQRSHNFIRLWTWELSQYIYHRGTMTYAVPFPWKRTGPGTARDGKPKFDLRKFDPAYFDRLRDRVVRAGARGMYVSVMLFEGHGLHGSLRPWCWEAHPFHAENNINGIDGDADGDGYGLETHMLKIPAVTALQEAYVCRVIDTLNDLDNLLYEIANESGGWSVPWQYHLIKVIHEHEGRKPKQHPVGMTFPWARDNRATHEDLLKSDAEWISPFHTEGYRDNPPAGDGSKVVISDTDHLWGIPKDDQIGDAINWVWKSLCRGLNPIFMDPYRPPEGSGDELQPKITWTEYGLGEPTIDMKWERVRWNMGHSRKYAQRMDLTASAPHSELASTGFCLAVPPTEYLVYLPDGGEVSVDLGAAKGKLAVEWFNPSTDEATEGDPVEGGDRVELTAPFQGHAVLYISAKNR
ncbi:MAG: hypothetical protein JXR37_01630 [Kiritimatiellae bacterium]|nr:hypothetical protein [Kiritimatiellia bacterium]